VIAFFEDVELGDVVDVRVVEAFCNGTTFLKSITSKDGVGFAISCLIGCETDLAIVESGCGTG